MDRSVFSEQVQRMKENQLTYNNEILDGNVADQTLTSKDDIARNKSFNQIARNLNKAKNIE